jgi:hypothetical protein
MDVKRRQSSRPGAKLTAALGATLMLLCGAFTAACGSSATGGAAPVSPGATGAELTAHVSPAAATRLRGMLPYVYTSSLTRERSYRSVKTVGDVVQMRHAVWTFRRASSDPRLAGREDVVLNADQRQRDMSATLWGTSRVTNAGGTWVKRWTGGVAAGGDVYHFYGTLRGAGGYAGLVAHESGRVTMAGSGSTSGLRIVGGAWIETRDGSPVPPAPGRGTTPPEWTPVVGIATMEKTAYTDPGPWVWSLRQSDARVSGRVEGHIQESGDARPDGSADLIASNVITNQDGAWNAPSGLVQVRGPGPRYEHFLYWTSEGSGAYTGLTYHGFWYFPETHEFVPGDEFVWTGWVDEGK